MLYIITEKQFYPLYILQILRTRSDIRVISYRRTKLKGLKHVAWNILRSIHATVFNNNYYLSKIIYQRDILRQLSQIKPEDHVLFFAMRNYKDIIALNAALKTKNKSIFFWDSMLALRHHDSSAQKFVKGLKKLGFHITTFDEADARKYNLSAVNEVYRKVPEYFNIDNIPAASLKNDIFLAATDKSRCEILTQVITDFVNQDIKCDITLISDKSTGKIPDELQPFYKRKFLKYAIYIKRALSARAFLEILQPGQSGMTIRTLEALFLNRKLITNNNNARTLDIYHPNNIYVLDGKEKRTVREFLDAPMYPINDNLMKRYDIEYWIEQFK